MVLAVRSHDIGDTVTVTVVRGNETKDLTVTLGSDETLQAQREQENSSTTNGLNGTTENGTRLSKDELLARGMNQSAIHEDVMVGAEDSHITGKCRDGHTVDLFRDGVWVL